MKPLSKTLDYILISFLAMSLFFITGCFDSDHPMDKLISSTTLENAVPFTIYSTEVQEGKSVKGGRRVQASVQVPFNIPREKLKPTTLAALKQIKEQHSKAEWFVVYLYPEGERAGKLGIHLGRGEYLDDKINIKYGLITEKEGINLEKRYKAGEMEYPTPNAIEESIFKIALGISEHHDAYYKENSDSDLSYQLVSQKTETAVETLKTIRNGFLQYYTYGQEQEIIQ